MLTTIPKILRPVAPILSLYWKPLLQWLSILFFERLLSRLRGHPLLELKELIAFGVIEEACATYHHQKGAGCPVTHSVPRLTRMLFLKYYGNHSLRELERQLAQDVVYRWFAGYGLFQKTADRTTLWAFEQYVRRHHPRLYFDTVLKQLDEAYPEQRKASQIGDTFGVMMNAAAEPLIKRLRHLADRLLRAYVQVEPENYHELAAQLDWVGLKGEQGERHESRLSQAERQVRLQRTVLAIDQMLSRLPTELPPSVVQWVDFIDKVIADETEVVVDEATGKAVIQVRKKRRHGSYRLVSATDPEATIRNHGQSKLDGYNVSVAVTTAFVREIVAATGAEPDAEGIVPLLAAQQGYHHLLPPKLIYDKAAGTGSYFSQVKQYSHGQTQLVAKLKQYKKQNRFGPYHFDLSKDGLSLTCPHGRTTHHRYGYDYKDGTTFKFSAGQCRGCPLLKPCRGSEAYPTSRRAVFISNHLAARLKAQAYNQTAAFRADLKLRPQVERIIAALVRYNGARQARFRGLAKVDFQMKMCAMAYNAKRWVQMRRRKRPTVPPREKCV